MADLSSLFASLAKSGGGDGPPPGDIPEGMRTRTKCYAYTDLLLAPSGRAVIAGEPSSFIARIGENALESCTADVLEIVASLGGLELLTEADPTGVLAALGPRADEVMPLLARFLACTPWIGPSDGAPSNAAPALSIGWKDDAELADGTLAMTPEQSGAAYLMVMTSALAVLHVVCVAGGAAAESRNGRALTEALLGSRHAAKALLRCVALVGQYNDADAASRGDEVALTAALLAREVVCALTSKEADVACFIDAAAHPFRSGTSARSVLEALQVVASLDLP